MHTVNVASSVVVAVVVVVVVVAVVVGAAVAAAAADVVKPHVHATSSASSSLVTGPSQNRLQTVNCHNFFSDSPPAYVSVYLQAASLF